MSLLEQYLITYDHLSNLILSYFPGLTEENPNIEYRGCYRSGENINIIGVNIKTNTYIEYVIDLNQIKKIEEANDKNH